MFLGNICADGLLLGTLKDVYLKISCHYLRQHVVILTMINSLLQLCGIEIE
jgi:hypothetical protein